MTKKAEVETQETVSLATSIVNLPVTVSVTVGGKVRTLNLPAIPDQERTRIVAHLIARGLKISLDNPYSTTDGTVSEKDAAAHKRLVAIQDGTFNPGGGGGGARLTPQQDAWIEWLQKKGYKVSGKTLVETQVSFRAAAMINTGKATKETALELAKTGIDQWVMDMESKNTTLSALIVAKMSLANGSAIEEEFVG
jgi:hypothetical protein